MKAMSCINIACLCRAAKVLHVLRSGPRWEKVDADPGRVIGEAPSAASQNRSRPMPNTVRLHRVLATRPEKIYRAFLEADALAKWLPPNGFTCTVHHLEPKVGGTHKLSFRNFTTGHGHS